MNISWVAKQILLTAAVWAVCISGAIVIFAILAAAINGGY